MDFKFDRTPWQEVTIPENSRPSGSINATLHELPVRRTTVADLKGLILFLPRTGMIVTPARIVAGGWNCTVVRGPSTYPRGGYDLHVSDWELQRAEEVWLGTFAPSSEPYTVRSSLGRGIFTLTPAPDIGPPEDDENGKAIALFATMPASED